MCVDSKGTTADHDTLLDSERRATFLRRGKLTQELHDRLSAADQAEPIIVDILGDGQAFPVPDRGRMETDAAYPSSIEQLQRASSTSVTDPIVAYVLSTGGRVLGEPETLLVTAALSRSAIPGLSNVPVVSLVSSAMLEQRPHLASAIPTIKADAVQNLWGVTGYGEKVCIVEGPRPDIMTWLPANSIIRNPSGSSSPHPRQTAEIVNNIAAGWLDVAPSSQLFFANDAPGDANATPPWIWCQSTNGTRAVNQSWGSSSHTSCQQNSFERWVDLRAAFVSPYFSHASSAGNDGATGFTSTKFHNGIVVGGVDDRGTTSRTDDLMSGFSSSLNPCSLHNDWELPHLVAPAENIVLPSTNPSGVYGTSFAAPAVAGTAALIYEEARNRGKPIDSWPEAVRAILLTSAYGNFDGSAASNPFASAADERDGVGLIDAYDAVFETIIGPSLGTGRGGFDKRSISAGTFNGGVLNQTWTFNAYANGKARIAIAWDEGVTCGADPMTACQYQDHLDLDLNLYGPSGNWVAGSGSWDNVVEYINTTTVSPGTHTIEVRLFGTWKGPATNFLGVSWVVKSS